MLIVFVLITNKVLIFDICIIFLGLHLKRADYTNYISSKPMVKPTFGERMINKQSLFKGFFSKLY